MISRLEARLEERALRLLQEASEKTTTTRCSAPGWRIPTIPMGNPWDNHGITMGKPWENVKTMGKLQKNPRKMGKPQENYKKNMGTWRFTLWYINVCITMAFHHVSWVNLLQMDIFHSSAKLPEGMNMFANVFRHTYLRYLYNHIVMSYICILYSY